MKQQFLLIGFITLFFFLPFTVQANSGFHCGANLIVLGASKQETFRKCGEPSYIEDISNVFERRSEQWYYDFGPGNFPRVLTFEGYRLINIKTLHPR